MENNIFGFEQIHFDVLAELGNIGAGNAITALSVLLDRRIDMKVPNVNIADFSQVSDFIGGPETTVAGIMVKLTADIEGMIIFLIEIHHVRDIISSLFQKEEILSDDGDDIFKLTEMELSAFNEIGNILISSYLTALAHMIDKKIVPTVPYLTIDMAGAILSVPAIEFSKVADQVLFIESVFKTKNTDVSGYFILVPDYYSFETIFSSLGVIKYE